MDVQSETFQLHYRLALDKDVDILYDLYMDDVSNPYLTYDHMDKNEFERIYHELLPTKTLYVVEADDKVIASYRLIPKSDRQAHTIYLGGFVVNHSLKGKGLGSKILEHIKNMATTEGVKRIELTVDLENEGAIRLYSKTGFVIEGHIRKSYKRSSTERYYDEYLMGLLL